MRKELEDALLKQATPKKEIGSMFAWNFLPYIGSVGNAVGGAAGSVEAPATEKDEEEWDKNPKYGLGYGAYRANRRLKRQLVDDKGTNPHYFSQGLGTGTALLASLLAGGLGGAVAGAGIGAGASIRNGHLGRNMGTGAGIGAITGGWLGSGLGLLATLAAGPAALMTKRRTKAEQKAYANSPTLKEYLVPGLGQYNMWKSIGRSVGDAEEREEKENKKEEKA